MSRRGHGGARPKYAVPLIPPPTAFNPEPCDSLPPEVKFILNILFENDGLVSLEKLQQVYNMYVRQNHIQGSPKLKSILKKNSALFQQDSPRNNPTVSVCARLDLCAVHASKQGNCSGVNCSALHICKFYIQGISCKFKDSCVFGHDLTNEHNANVLNDLNLDGISVDILRNIYKLSEPHHVKYPPVCRFYNSSGCKHDRKGGLGCPGLHVCLHYIKGDCRFGKTCKRDHNILNPQARTLLQKFGVDLETHPNNILKKVREALMDTDISPSRSRPMRAHSQGRLGSQTPLSVAASSPQKFGSLGNLASKRSTSQANIRTRKSSECLDTPSKDCSDEIEPCICLFHLRGSCLFGEKCRNIHTKKPYLWQYLDVGATSGKEMWCDFDDACNREIEYNYCTEQNDKCFSTLGTDRTKQPFRVNFDNMSVQWNASRVSKMKRLSTISTIKASPGQPFATRWRWFWEDDDKNWKEYGKDTDDHSTFDIEELEDSYCQNPEGTYSFATLCFKYTIKFKIMVQRNVGTGKERRIRRRPEYKPEIANRYNTSGDKDSPDAAPSHWDMSSTDDKNFQLIKIESTGSCEEEYELVQRRFQETMPGVKIVNIYRIQNLELWQGYSWKKKWMRQKTDSNKDPEEKLLFHGTRNEYLEAICQQGFDWRLSGTSVGTLYGKGSYFARDAKYSDCYTDCQMMFLVRVLVGSFAQGSGQYTRPPPVSKDKANILYDSCVDNINNPSIYVVFEHQQSYPEYVIKYAK